MKIVYSPEQSVIAKEGEIGLRQGQLSPSVNKPKLVVEAWEKAGIPLEVIPSMPVGRGVISLAHGWLYTSGVLDGKIENGHGNYHPGVITALPWVVGSFVKAARLAYETKESYVSPTSGFHHAGYEEGEGYCTFNGLMVAAQSLIAAFPGIEIGILDFDDHYGDGTDNIIKTLRVDEVTHFTYGRSTRYLDDTDEFLDGLDEYLEQHFRVGIIFYQAGADSHIHDPLGSQSMTTEHMRLRDEIVFSFCKRNKIPVVWNLAGGYQTPIEKVLALHVQTAQVFEQVFGA